LPLLKVHRVEGGEICRASCHCFLILNNYIFLLFSYVMQEIWGKNIKVNISDSERHEPQEGTSGAIKNPEANSINKL